MARTVRFSLPDGRPGTLSVPDDWSSERIGQEVDLVIKMVGAPVSRETPSSIPEEPTPTLGSMSQLVPGQTAATAPPPKASPPPDMGRQKAIGSGLVKGTMDIGTALAQMGMRAVGDIFGTLPGTGIRGATDKGIERLAEATQEREQAHKSHEANYPVMARVAEAAPGVAASLAMPVPGSTTAPVARILTNTAQGGLFSMATAPVSKPEQFETEKLKDLAIGAGTSGVASGAIEGVKKVAGPMWKWARSHDWMPGSKEYREGLVRNAAVRQIAGERSPDEFIDQVKRAPTARSLPEATGEQADADLYARLKGIPEGAELAARETDRVAIGRNQLQKALAGGGAPQVQTLATDYVTKATRKAGETVRGRTDAAQKARDEIGAPRNMSAIGEAIQNRLAAPETGRKPVLEAAREAAAVSAAGGREAWEQLKASDAPDLEPVRRTIQNLIDRSGNPVEKNALRRALDELLPETREVPITPQVAERIMAEARSTRNLATITEAMERINSGTAQEQVPFTIGRLDSFRRWLSSGKVPGATDPADRLKTRDAQEITEAVKGVFPEDHPYREFMRVYSEASRPLDWTRTPRGRYATKEEFGTFTGDVSSVAKRYLTGTKEAADDLIEAWGGKDAALTDFVRSYVHNSVAQASPKQMQDFLRKNAGLFDVFPEARQAVETAATSVLRAERAAAGLKAVEATLSRTSDPMAVLTSKNAQDAMKTILAGPRSDEQMASLARRIGRTPEGKMAIRGAARDMILEGDTPRKMVEAWDVMRNNIQRSGAMSTSHVSAVNRIMDDLRGLLSLSEGRASRGDISSSIRNLTQEQKAGTNAMQAAMIVAGIPWGRAWSVKAIANAEIAAGMDQMSKELHRAMVDMMMNPDEAIRMARSASEGAATQLARKLAEGLEMGRRAATFEAGRELAQ